VSFSLPFFLSKKIMGVLLCLYAGDYMIDKTKIKSAVCMFLEAIGEDKNREGLSETPQRVADMCEELFEEKGPTTILKEFGENTLKNQVLSQKTQKNEFFENWIVVKNIPVYSVCEHHLLPFFGEARVAYIPAGSSILGLSKLARAVAHFAKRLQVQERLTNQIADYIFENASVSAVFVAIEAQHLCMAMRGTKAQGSKTFTTTLREQKALNSNEKIEILNMLLKP
jgi:GTP cyclohydrolase I